MNEATYREMTVEHLGAEANEEDLATFYTACASYQQRVGCSDLEATDYIWGSGDWIARALRELDAGELE